MKTPLAFVALALMTTSAFAATDWNGTWVGNWSGAGSNGVQIMMAGNVATGIFWNGDYLPDELHAKVSADGKTLTITWDHSSATLTRDGAETAHAVIREPGKPDAAFAVKIDH
jgi:hypothetical protein